MRASHDCQEPATTTCKTKVCFCFVILVLFTDVVGVVCFFLWFCRTAWRGGARGTDGAFGGGQLDVFSARSEAGAVGPPGGGAARHQPRLSAARRAV